jgi:hypothetical protein
MFSPLHTREIFLLTLPHPCQPHAACNGAYEHELGGCGGLVHELSKHFSLRV